MTATDIIYTRADKTDYGTIQNPELDYECGTDAKNTFELTVPLNGVSIKKGAYVYIDGSDYMGQVTTIDPSSIDNTMIYGGPTWQGILDQRIIQPDSGQGHYHVSGDANTVLGAIISRIGLSSIMGASTTASGITVSHDFRYQKGYAGISAMLSAVGSRVTGSVSGGKIILHAESITDWSQNHEYDGEQTQINMAVDYRPVNHLIALGSGEGVNRIRYDLYADANGNISTTQTLFGEDLHEETYDYTSADLATLQTEAPKKLQEYIDAAVTITVNTSISNIGIGDIAGAYIGDTGMSAKATVTKKTVKLSNGVQSVSFTAGGAKSSSIEDVRSELSRQSLNAINEAISAHDAAAAAQATANSKVTTYYQTNAPTAKSPGDLWIDTDDGNALHRWSGSAWVLVDNSKLSQALQDAADAQATADGKIVTFAQTSAPTAASIGDLWVDTDDANKLYRWSGSAWSTVRDTGIAAAQSTADSKVEHIFAATAPDPTTKNIGDKFTNTTTNLTYTVVDE